MVSDGVAGFPAYCEHPPDVSGDVFSRLCESPTPSPFVPERNGANFSRCGYDSANSVFDSGRLPTGPSKRVRMNLP